MVSDGRLRQPTAEEADIIGRVAVGLHRLRALRLDVDYIALAPDLWGSESDHFSFLFGLPVMENRLPMPPDISFGVVPK